MCGSKGAAQNHYSQRWPGIPKECLHSAYFVFWYHRNKICAENQEPHRIGAAQNRNLDSQRWPGISHLKSRAGVEKKIVCLRA